MMTSLCCHHHAILISAPGATARCTVKIRCHNLQKVVDEFKKCSQSPEFRAHNHRDYFSVVRRLASANQLSMVEDIVEHQKKFEDITNEQFTARLILLYGRAGMFDHARKLFDEMHELNCERTVWSFNALLSACVDAGKYDKLDEIFRDFPSKFGITPNVVSFNTLIKGYCETRNLDSGVLVLDEMEKSGVEPDVATFNTLLNGFYGCGNFSQGEQIWGLMETKNIVPNVRSYNSRLRGLVAGNRTTEAVDLFSEMEEKGVEPDVISFNAIIKGFCNDGDVEKVNYWHSKLREHGCKPDRVTYVTLIPFLCQNEDFSTALELCIELVNQGLPVRAALIQPVVEGLVKQSRVEEAKELVELGNSKEHISNELHMPVELV